MKGWVVSGCLAGALLLASTHARATEQRRLGFSNLVLRVENSTGISIAPDAYRVIILERLRERGLEAVGAESIVFGRDEAQLAERVLGGTIKRLECVTHEALNCRVTVQWEVLDVASGSVAYEATTSYAHYGVDRDRLDAAGQSMVLGALDKLVARPKFRAMLKLEKRAERVRSYAEASFLACGATPSPLPGGSEAAMDATVVIENGEGFGSGFFLNKEGLLATAAHVVESGPLTIRKHDGSRFSAVVVRSNRKSDIALLRPTSPTVSSCLPLDDHKTLVGADVYVIGTPASRDFAFSMTRGIVSGARIIEGAEFWQTDASINPGNSGGPMLTSAGRAFAVTSWKVTGGVEGLGFGAPLELGLRGLALKPSDHTDAVLWQSAPEAGTSAVAPQRIVDAIDDLPTLDPAAERRHQDKLDNDRREAEQAKEKAALEQRQREEAAELDRMTPGYVKGLKYGGAGLALLGVVGVIASASEYEVGKTTEPEYRSLRLLNDLSWIGVVVGAGASVTGFVLTPRKLKRGPVKDARLHVLPHGLVIEGRFQ